MDILERMRRSIMELFPDITAEEFRSRMELTIGLIKMEMHKNNTYRKDYPS